MDLNRVRSVSTPRRVGRGDPGEIRTPDRVLRTDLLYPAELRGLRVKCVGRSALDGNGGGAQKPTRVADRLKIPVLCPRPNFNGRIARRLCQLPRRRSEQIETKMGAHVSLCRKHLRDETYRTQ